LSRGQPLVAILAEIGHVAEGVQATSAANDLAAIGHRYADRRPFIACCTTACRRATPCSLLAREPRASDAGQRDPTRAVNGVASRNVEAIRLVATAAMLASIDATAAPAFFRPIRPRDP
jgi:hypothetical protein